MASSGQTQSGQTKSGQTKYQQAIVQERPKGEQPRRHWGFWLLTGLLLVSLLSAPFLLLRPGADIYVLRTYETAVVQRGTLTDYVRGTGSVTPRTERSVLAPAEGNLAEWLVAEGDEVGADSVLGRFTSKELGAALADAQKRVQAAELALARAELEGAGAARQREVESAALGATQQTAEKALATAQQLFDAGAAPRRDVEAAQTALTQAQSDLEAHRLSAETAAATQALTLEAARLELAGARSALAAEEDKVARLELRAPVAGRVMSLAVGVGDAVPAQGLLASVASAQDVQVSSRVPETQASRLSAGQSALLRVGGETYPGSVAQVSPNTQSSEQGAVVPVILTFERVPAAIRIGSSASVEIEVDRKENALYLPRGAFLSTGGERFVYRAEAEEAVRTPVIFGLTDGNSVEVRDGLAEGDVIISGSYEAFKDKLTVQLSPEGNLSR